MINLFERLFILKYDLIKIFKITIIESVQCIEISLDLVFLIQYEFG